MIGQKSIAPHETVHIDVKELRDQQIPDEPCRITFQNSYPKDQYADGEACVLVSVRESKI